MAKELSNGHQQILQEGIKRRTIKMTRLPYFSTISWLLLVHSTAVGVQAFQSPSKSGSGGVSRSILSARTLPLRPALFASKKPLDRAHKGESDPIEPRGYSKFDLSLLILLHCLLMYRIGTRTSHGRRLEIVPSKIGRSRAAV